jgi:glycosyltransferase involved in cell wall biosynthesis
VLLDRPRWYWRRGNTDHAYLTRNLSYLGTFHPEIATETLSAGRSVSANADEFTTMLRRRFGRRPALTWTHTRSVPSDIDLVYSNDAFPLKASQPVVWQNTMLSPEMRLARGDSREALDHEAMVKRSLFSRAAAVLVSTEAERARILGQFPELAGKLHACPFLMPGVTVQPDTLRKHVGTETVRVLFVGNQARRKGLADVYGAWARLAPEVLAKAHLTVVSRFLDGEVEPPTVPNVTVLRGAPHTQVLDLMRASHVLLNPARFESYGFVFIEAMAAGAVPVGPGWEVQRELLDDGAAGVLIVPGDVSALRGAIEGLAQDDARRTEMASRGLDLFEKHYAPAVVAERLRQILVSAAR